MKKLFLGALFSRDELDIVDQQDVHGVEAVAEADHAVKPQRIDHFDGEFFRADVTQPHRRIALLDGVPDGMHQVRLAHAHTAVEEQRVVGLRRLFGNGARSGMRKLVGLANHKRIERVARVQLVVAALKIQFCLPRPRRGHRRRLNRLLFRAYVLHLHIRRADLMKDGLDDLAVRARQHLPENGAGNLDVEGVAFRPVQPGRLEPGGKGVDADPGLHPL